MVTIRDALPEDTEALLEYEYLTRNSVGFHECGYFMV